MHRDGRYRVGIDIGGTFADLVLIDDASGEQTVGKVLTIPEDPSEAVATGLTELLESRAISAADLKMQLVKTQ